MAPLSLVGMAGRHWVLDLLASGLEPVYMVCGMAAPHLLSAVAVFYRRLKRDLLLPHRNMPVVATDAFFFASVPFKRCFLVVFRILEQVCSKLVLSGGGLYAFGIYMLRHTLILYCTDG